MANYAIIDANGFCFRAFAGYEPILDKEGKDNRVLYGMLKLINKIPEHFPDINYLFVVFDPKNSDLYRKSLFPAYKANRPPKDPDFERQKNETKHFLENVLGLPTVSYEGYEADDIVGSLTYIYGQDKKNNITVISPDKDLFQLVSNNVNILRPFKKQGVKGYEIITEEGVYKKFGVSPDLVADVLALIGDDVDNIPKVGSIGVKSASKLLNKYISLEHLIAVANEIEGQIGENLRNSLDILPTIKQLTKVKCDLDLFELSEKAIEKAIQIQSHIGYKHKIEEFSQKLQFQHGIFNLFLTDEVK